MRNWLKIFCLLSMANSREIPLKIMTFNTFFSGALVEMGFEKIAKHILANKPDIVFLQEVFDVRVLRILNRLDRRAWNSCSRNHGNLNHILTPLEVLTEYDPSEVLWNNGCRVRYHSIDGDYLLNLWNVHLYPGKYGPYKACSKLEPMKSISDLYKCEINPVNASRGRMDQVINLSHHEPFQNIFNQAASPSGPPLILAGDFNSPSHLDWTEAAKPLHCQVAFDWPATKYLEQLGFIDSFRSIRPDPVRDPGATWSTIYKNSTSEIINGRPEAEPQDRIDFIFYKSANLRVVNSYVYSGYESIGLFPNFDLNDWPSDHSSVVSDFIWTIG